MAFVFIALAAAGGAVAVICLMLLIVVIIRSRGVKWIDSIGIHFLTSKRIGEVSIVQDIISLQNPIAYEVLIKKWSEAIQEFPIFTHTVVKRRMLWSYFKESDCFDLANHIFQVKEPISKQEITQYCQQQIMEPLREDLPLWRAVIFSNVQEGGSVILLRYHRCLADSASMMQLLLMKTSSVLDPSFDTPESLLKASFESSSSSSESTHSQDIEQGVISTIPVAPPPCGLQSSSTASFWRLICTGKDTANPLRPSALAIPKERAFQYQIMDTLVDEIKEKLRDIAINDVLIGSIFHAVHIFFASRLTQMKTKQLHSLLWINRNVSDYILSPIADSEHFQPSNKDLTTLILNVPLKLDTTWDCAMNVHHQLWKTVSSKEPTVVQKWIRFWGWLPRCFGDPCFSSFTRRGPLEKTAIISNPIQSLIHASPPVGNESCHFSVLCYSNHIAISIVSDLLSDEDLSSILHLCNKNIREVCDQCV